MKMIKKKIIPLSVGRYLNTVFAFNQKKAVNKAFSIFCTPRKGKIMPHQLKFLNSANTSQVIFQNEKIHLYIWPGSGKTILLVHGWESNSHRWRKLVLELQKKNYHIVSIDAPAHGASTGKEINVILYAECLQKLMGIYNPHFVIGHSIGAMTSIFNHYTYKNPSVEKMVALGSPSEFEKIMQGYQKLLKLKNPFMQELERFFQATYGFKFEEFSAAKFAAQFDVPGLIVHDQQDKIVPIEASEGIHKKWKNSQFIRTEGLGHSLQSDDINLSIINFLET